MEVGKTFTLQELAYILEEEGCRVEFPEDVDPDYREVDIDFDISLPDYGLDEVLEDFDYDEIEEYLAKIDKEYMFGTGMTADEYLVKEAQWKQDPINYLLDLFRDFFGMSHQTDKDQVIERIKKRINDEKDNV